MMQKKSRIVKDKFAVIMFRTIKLPLNLGQKFTRRKLLNTSFYNVSLATP
jgi:hypothetical protein